MIREVWWGYRCQACDESAPTLAADAPRPPLELKATIGYRFAGGVTDDEMREWATQEAIRHMRETGHIVYLMAELGEVADDA